MTSIAVATAPPNRPAALSRRWVWLLAAAATVLLGGCLSLPTDGPVAQGEGLAQDPDSIDLLAPDPPTDASPVEIVRGFLVGAASGLSDDYSVALKYLTESARQTWRADGVTIHSGMENAVAEGDPANGQVLLQVPLVATVDAAGTYVEAQPGQTTTAEFELEQDEAGQWRISSLPDGVLMNRVEFGSSYREFPVYFISLGPEPQLVPDVRWLPQAAIARTAVRELVRGPVGWLAPGVLSAFPAGTELGVDGVQVDEGVAAVSLSTEFLAARPADRALALAQIDRTLRQLPQVRSVRIVVDGTVLDIDTAAASVAATAPATGSLIVAAEEGLGRFNGDQVIVEESAPPFPSQLSGLALPYGDRPLVALDEGSRLTTVPGAEQGPVALLEGEGALVAPSYDLYGWVWTAEASPAGSLLAVDPVAGETVSVSAPDIGGSLVALRVSREGARLVYAVVADGLTRIHVAAIERDQTGAPVAVHEPRAGGAPTAGVRGLVWVEETRVAALSVNDGVTSVQLSTVGGTTVTLPTIEGVGAGIAAGSDERELYLSTTDGHLYGRSGLGWQVLATEVREPTFAG